MGGCQLPVCVVDDDEGVRRSLGLLLGAQGFTVRTFASASAALARLEEIVHGCILTDVKMPGVSGLELLGQVRRAGFSTPVMVMTGHADVAMAVAAMKLGATDFIEKPFDPDELLTRLESLARAAARDHEADAMRLRLRELSGREREVFDLLVEGATNKEAAARLGLSPRTVEIHRANLMQKLGVRRLSGLIHLAMRASAEDGHWERQAVHPRTPPPDLAWRSL